MSGTRGGSLIGWGILLLVLSVVAAALLGGPRTVRAQSAPCATLVAPPPEQAVMQELHGVAAGSPNDVWAVGEAAGPGPLAILSLHWNGAAWQKLPLPALPPDTISQRLGAVMDVGGTAWAVGDYMHRDSDFALVLRWDGRAWQQMALPAGLATGALRGVGGTGPDDVWAVGAYYDGAARRERPRFLHWDGAAWTGVPAPDSWPVAVSARARDDAWAVGTAAGITSILHWNGTAWAAVEFPTALHNVSFNAVQALAPDDVWAAGSSEAGPLVGHWDGHTWQAVPIPESGSFPSALNGIAAVAPDDIWITGSRVVVAHNAGSQDLVTLHWDGHSWTSVPVASPGPFTVGNAAAAAGGNVWVVGSYVATPESRTRGLIYRLGSGPCPSPVATASPAPPGSASPTPIAVPGTGSITFPETGQTVSGLFLDYWRNHGGLAQQGYPISGLISDISPTDGRRYTVQYFERAVFEYHPENQPEFRVLLSLLGRFRYAQTYPAGGPAQRPNTDPGTILFPETGTRVGGRFLEYWRAHGGLMQQGLPISDEFTEVSPLDGKPYTVQYFERAVFEWHPDNKAPYDVLLSQLGTFRWTATNGRR